MNALLGSRGHQWFPVENYTGTLIHNQIMGRAALFSTDLAFHNTQSPGPLRIYLRATEGKYFQTMLSVSSNMAHPQISAIFISAHHNYNNFTFLLLHTLPSPIPLQTQLFKCYYYNFYCFIALIEQIRLQNIGRKGMVAACLLEF